MMKFLNWWQFTKERFEPLSHFTMIFVFLLAHVLVVNPVININASMIEDIFLFIAVVAFYFKLRLYDEVKDYQLDCIINKTRPLPRGLLNHKDMYSGMVLCIFFEIIIFSYMGFNSLLSIIITILYSLLMFKEFFIKEMIRPHLTTYALLHTIVTSLLSFAIFSFLTKESFFTLILNKTLISFALASWMLFNIFEFGRKTYATSEERENVSTYSSLFGRYGAVALVLSQAIVANLLCLNLSGAHPTFLISSLNILFFILLLLSIFYILKNNSQASRYYRTFSSLYIVLFFLLIIISHVIP